MLITDPSTGFPVGDPDTNPFPSDFTGGTFGRASEGLILSASGWRKVFAANGDEESTAPDLTPHDRELAALMALAYGEFLVDRSGDPSAPVVVGIDARHTGPAIADIMLRVFLGMGLKPEYLFISAAPEIMAYAKLSSAHGFAYVTASHNPIGHNGVKFGLDTGGVIGGRDAAVLIRSLEALGSAPDSFERVKSLLERADSSQLERLYRGIGETKRAAKTAYAAFSRQVIAGSKDPAEWDALKQAARLRPLGVVAELNGSARGAGIDLEFLAEAGIAVKAVNERPRDIVHRIVPEGESLDLCRSILAEESATKREFVLGYVPDNDGDRGNIVYKNDRAGTVDILEAQEVFALAVLSELAYLVWSGRLSYGENGKAGGKVAVAVNGPTSLRIEAIAKAFDVRVFRAEVGEANVVNLAEDLRKSGYLVRILGEGSNGGNITHPAAVRDPLNTVFAFLKLLWLRDNGDRRGLFGIWCDRAGLTYTDDFTLADVVAALPAFTTTSAFEPQAKMDIRCDRHGRLKEAYETLFPARWNEIKGRLFDELGVTTWREINYEGPAENHGVGSDYRSGRETGGFKILFKDDSGAAKAFIWMRGSGTEPVFRVLADVAGDRPDLEAWLLARHRDLIAEADALALET